MFVIMIKENYCILGWFFVFICFMVVVWLFGCCYYFSKEGRIMGRYSVRLCVIDCGVFIIGMLIVIMCVVFLFFFV